MAAVLCIVGPWIIPIGVIPISLTNMAVYLTIILLDKRNAMISVLLYLLIGFIGLPVFSGFGGGAGKLFGPTGGYLLGYLVLTKLAGSVLMIGEKEANKKNGITRESAGSKSQNVKTRIQRQIVALVLGTLGLYLFGTLWLMLQSNLGFFTAVSVGVIPFVVFDAIKIVVAVFLGNEVKKRMRDIV